jgi:hypothetical protein
MNSKLLLMIVAGIAGLALLSGCETAQSNEKERAITELRDKLATRETQLVSQKATIDGLNEQLAVAKSISEDDLKRIFYPERIEIDRLTGGFDKDGKPGDDGVVVYFRPIDRKGDVIKVAGDVKIQLFDLAAEESKNLIGEYVVPVDKLIDLWYGKMLTNHFSVNCPWLNRRPEHPEITVRLVFVDYLTKRVIATQAVCKVKLPPD